ncbi:DUF1232 domain-containing protein [Streptomyces sp. NPDC059506]|uniref:YkvA family protein n=1 Tax=Streptomyces thermolineatus TaxID=44033 RepID=A0ABN3KYL7_9ACTN|nr:YkvA family protein [Streptomyces sp. SCUT-3]QMV20949.1 DUF1232 domain-containing protein [Streptomyces sp. SCUT-3]
MSTGETVLVVVLALAGIAVLAVGIRFAVKLVGVYRDLRAKGMTTSDRLVFWGALLYTLSPLDLVPDPVYLDDVGVLLLALRHLHAAAAKAGLPGTRGPGADRTPAAPPR